MAPWLIERVTAVGVEPALTACVLLWLRLLPLFLVLPWLALRSAPSLALVLASVAGALVLTPLAFAGGVPLLREGVPLMAAGASELARGAVLAIGCALPWTLLGASGVLSDALRGARSQHSPLAVLFTRTGIVVALAASAQLGALRLFVSTLERSTLGSVVEIAGVGPLLIDLGSLVVQAFELSVALTAPVLLGVWICIVLLGLLSRVTARWATPLAAPVLLPWLGLAIVCLFSASLLDEVPDLVQLFTQKTTRLLGALH